MYLYTYRMVGMLYVIWEINKENCVEMVENIYIQLNTVHWYINTNTHFAFILNSQCYIHAHGMGFFFVIRLKLEKSRQRRETKTANLKPKDRIIFLKTFSHFNIATRATEFSSFCFLRFTSEFLMIYNSKSNENLSECVMFYVRCICI